MREGDYLVGIGDTDVKWSSHGDVVKMIRDAENSLKLRLVTPLDRSLIKLQSSNLINSKPAKTVLSSSLSSPSSTTSSSSGLSMSACPVSSEETFSPASSESGKLLLIFSRDSDLRNSSWVVDILFWVVDILSKVVDILRKLWIYCYQVVK